MEGVYTVAASPHLRESTTIPRIMWSVAGSLVPAWIGAIYFFGWPALTLTCLAVAAAVAAEALVQKFGGKAVTIQDGSAVVTGMLLAFNLPPGVPFWIPILGSFFAIIIGKHVLGALGHNPMNPALLGRAFLMASWPVHMTADWLAPRGGSLSGIDAVTTATPLNVLKASMKTLADPAAANEKLVGAEQALNELFDFSTYADLFYGRVGGCLGETSALLLLVGAVFLLYKRYIEWRLPLCYIGTVALLGWIFGGPQGNWFQGDPIFHILSGGLFLGAFFMATDMVTSPLTNLGKAVCGMGCGCLTILIRLKGGYPEGVCYSILLMNLTVPLIDRFTRPRKFGELKKARTSC